MMCAGGGIVNVNGGAISLEKKIFKNSLTKRQNIGANQLEIIYMEISHECPHFLLHHDPKDFRNCPKSKRHLWLFE